MGWDGKSEDGEGMSGAGPWKCLAAGSDHAIGTWQWAQGRGRGMLCLAGWLAGKLVGWPARVGRRGFCEQTCLQG